MAIPLYQVKAVEYNDYDKNDSSLSEDLEVMLDKVQKARRTGSFKANGINYQVFRDTPFFYVVLHAGKRPIGYVYIRQDEKQRLRVIESWVDPDHQGKGLIYPAYQHFIDKYGSLSSDVSVSKGALKVWHKLADIYNNCFILDLTHNYIMPVSKWDPVTNRPLVRTNQDTDHDPGGDEHEWRTATPPLGAFYNVSPRSSIIIVFKHPPKLDPRKQIKF